MSTCQLQMTLPGCQWARLALYPGSRKRRSPFSRPEAKAAHSPEGARWSKRDVPSVLDHEVMKKKLLGVGLEAMEVSRRKDIMPTDFTKPCLQGDFLDWAVRDLTRSWGEGGRAWFNMYVGLYEPWHWSACHPRCVAACSVSRDRLLPERFCCWSC